MVMRFVLEKPDPRPEVDRVAFEGLISRGRDRARRTDGGTGAIIFCSFIYEMFLVRVECESKYQLAYLLYCMFRRGSHDVCGACR